MIILVIAMMAVGCSVKKDDPELLIPPSDYDVDAVETEGVKLCVETHPKEATIRVSSRVVEDCIQVKGEVFVEVEADGFQSYRELLVVEQDLNHKAILVPLTTDISKDSKIEYPMPTYNQTPQAFVQPSNSVELCVVTEPADAYLRINGIKKSSGSCLLVQNAAEIVVEADGFQAHKQLLSLPPLEKKVEHTVILQPLKTKKATEISY